MTPHEKAVAALNARLERLQANLRDAQAEAVQRTLFQALVATLGVGEALNDYIKSVGQYAQRRNRELKQVNETLAAQHAESLQSGRALLEKLKANPGDRTLRQEIEATQRSMAAIQKDLRRGTHALQRELSHALATLDEVAESVRRFGEATDTAALKRLAKSIVTQVRDHYTALPVPAKNLIDAAAWEKSARSSVEHAAGFHEAFARAGYQMLLAFELMTLAMMENPPGTAEEAQHRANDSVAARLKEIAGRFDGN